MRVVRQRQAPRPRTALGRLDPETRGDLGFRRSDLVALVQDVGATHADQAVEKSIDLELITSPLPALATVQPEMMTEALSNLIDNAIRYTPPGGRVLIEVMNEPTSIRVSDSGPGIPKDERLAVFERFVRGRLATGEGTGPGLAIARDIATLHRATVILDQSEWGGVSVTITFGDSSS